MDELFARDAASARKPLDRMEWLESILDGLTEQV
jgi:hypothetical protein